MFMLQYLFKYICTMYAYFANNSSYFVFKRMKKLLVKLNNTVYIVI